MTSVAGVDGCRVGSVGALQDLRTGAVVLRVTRTFGHLLELPEAPEVVAVDVPIGFDDAANRQTCLTLTERGEKSFWTRIGAAFTNKDGSITVALDALPVSGRLQIRENEDREERSERRDRR